MSYPIDTIEGLDLEWVDLLPGVFIFRRLLTPDPQGGSSLGRSALQTFHATMGPSPWTPVFAGAVLGGLALGAAVIVRNHRQGR